MITLQELKGMGAAVDRGQQQLEDALGMPYQEHVDREDREYAVTLALGACHEIHRYCLERMNV